MARPSAAPVKTNALENALEEVPEKKKNKPKRKAGSKKMKDEEGHTVIVSETPIFVSGETPIFGNNSIAALEAKLDLEDKGDNMTRLRNLLEYWEAGNLNIYQVAALSSRAGTYTVSRPIVKAIFMLLLQLLAIPMILADAGFNGEKEFCEMNSWAANWKQKLVGFLFLLYLAYKSHQADREYNGYVLGKEKLVDGKKLKELEPENPAMLFFTWYGQPEIANVWFIIGMYTNILANYIGGVGAILLLYSQSPTPLSILLNALAIGFVNTLDDDVVTPHEKKEAIDTVKKWKAEIQQKFAQAEFRVKHSYSHEQKAEHMKKFFREEKLFRQNSPVWDYLYKFLWGVSQCFIVFMYCSSVWLMVCY